MATRGRRAGTCNSGRLFVFLLHMYPIVSDDRLSKNASSPSCEGIADPYVCLECFYLLLLQGNVSNRYLLMFCNSLPAAKHGKKWFKKSKFLVLRSFSPTLTGVQNADESLVTQRGSESRTTPKSTPQYMPHTPDKTCA